jgi:acetyl esterase/lipase
MEAMNLPVLILLLPVVCTAAVYKIDCADARWRSLDAVNALELHPGDQLQLRSGCRWTGTLHPRGSGTAEKPLKLDRYGEGALPRIDGGGAEAALLLDNQEFWEVGNLELTNDAPEPGLRRGVLVRGENLGHALRHITLHNLEIHNIRGKLGADMVSKCTGGIGFEIIAKEKSTRLDDILIENNHIHTADGMGIYINSDLAPHPRDPQWEQLHHTRVVVRGNRLEDIGKNAMCVRAALAPLIERNIVRNAAARYHGNAIYVFGCKNARIQYNEVSGTQYLKLEGAAFDSDYNSEGTVIQYNYAHENGGGLVDVCSNPALKNGRGYNDGTVIRYNVSRNDTDRVVAFDGPATNTQIYNNTLYVGRGLAPHIIEFDIFGEDPGWPDHVAIRNNIIVNDGQGTYLYGKATNYSFEGNCFSGTHPANEPQDARKVLGDPRFEAADTLGASFPSVAGYRLREGSPCAGSGVAIADNGGRDILGIRLPAKNIDRGALQTSAFDLTDGLLWASPGGHDLVADLYLPKGRGPFPVVVYLHGGGWSSGDRKQLRRQAADLASRGIAGFAVEYRLAPKFKYPAALYDAKAAVRWVRSNAEKYRFDSDRIAVAGSSAGGHLAALLALTSGDPKYEGDVCCTGISSAVSAVVAFNPVLDLTDMAHRASLGLKFLGGGPTELPDVYRDASPIFHVHKTATPFLILHGTADETVPYRHAVAMTEKLKAAGDSVQLFTADGGPHTFWTDPRWYTPSLEVMEEFLRTALHFPAK